jgi:hypothetical protein
MNKFNINTIKFFGLILIALRVCEAVKITELKVPKTHILGVDPNPIVLDCLYDIDKNEYGFVLKWYLNGIPVYQWIPTQSAFALGAFKGRVDQNYTVSQDPKKKQRALVIREPLSTDSGMYTCDVQSFVSNDRKMANLLVIDPEDSLTLTYDILNDDTISVKCSATNIHPKPKLTIYFDDEERKGLEVHEDIKDSESGSTLDVSITVEIKKEDLQDDTDIKCVLRVPESSYEKTVHKEYDENSAINMKLSSTLFASAAIVWLASLF